MEYLGLVDIEEDEDDADDGEEEPSGRGRTSSYQEVQSSSRSSASSGGGATVSAMPDYGQTATVRTLNPEEVRDVPPSTSSRPAIVRAIIPNRTARVHVVAPVRFSDAQEIGDLVKASSPVIVNLQAGERDLARRMIDFCSGVTYALGGTMEKVADQVFLLTPSNVEVSAEERQRLQERGLFQS
jgi:cell division inhibitor SepF